MRLRGRLLVLSLVTLACKKAPSLKESAATKPSAAPSVTAKQKPKPVTATSLTVVRCNLTDPPREGSKQRRRDAPPAPRPRRTSCRKRAFDSLRAVAVTLSGKMFTYHGTGPLMRMNLDAPECEPKEVVKLEPIPEQLSLSRAWTGNAGEDLLVGIPREDWKWSRELFRFDAQGKFVRKYGAAEGKGELHCDVTGCGDGLCTWPYMSHVEVYDRDGQRLNEIDLAKATRLARVFVSAVVDVPNKGVYALIGYHPDPTHRGREAP